MKTGRPPATLRKHRVASQQGYEVYTVSSYAVRELTAPDEEFTNFAIHEDFPDLIPDHEIWVDERLFEAEGIFYLANALVRLKIGREGGSSDRGYAAALDVERALRERLVGVKFRHGKPHKRVPGRIYAGRYEDLPDAAGPIVVRLVDGNLVRSVYKTDYTEGGHGYVYRWVPKGEIWVERVIAASEIPFIVSHEYLELRLMRDRGLKYDPAHAAAAKVEFKLREGASIKSLLTTARRPLAKADLPGLTRPEFFEAFEAQFVAR